MKLILPNKKYERSFKELIVSAKNYGDYKELGNSLIRDGETFEEMLKRLNYRRIGKRIAKRDVPSTVYWIVDNDRVVGTIDLRHKLNEDYFERLGHVAYYIRPEERNRGYATKALSLAIKKYYNKYTKKILITCFSDNNGSSRVIEKNGGILEKKVIDEVTKKEISRYIIEVRDDSLIIPKTAWLTTNRTCNNKCNWCYASNCKDKLINCKDMKKICKRIT